MFQYWYKLDPLDPTLSATWTFILRFPDGTEAVRKTGSTPAGYDMGDYAVNFEAIKITNDLNYRDGWYTWEFTVTDSAGKSTTWDSRFTVIKYSRPRIDYFEAERYAVTQDDEGNEITVLSDDSPTVRYRFTAAADMLGGWNKWHIFIVDDKDYWTRNIFEESKDPADESKSWYINNDKKFPGDSHTYNPKEDIIIDLILEDGLYSVMATALLPKAGGYLNVEKNGVAVGQRTTGTAAAKKFEVAPDYASLLYGGIQSVGGGDLCTSSQLALGFQCGSILDNGSIGSAKTQDNPIDFETPFAEGTIPIVVASFFSTSTAGNFGRCCVSVLDVSNQGFILRCFNGDANSRTPHYQWLAIGQAAPEGDVPVIRPARAMKSNSSQNCVASASTENASGSAAWHAFDSVLTDYWASKPTDMAPWIQLQMPDKLKNITISVSSRSNATPKAPYAGEVWLSNNGSNYSIVKSFSGWNSNLNGGLLGTIDCENETGYSYVRLVFENNTGTNIIVGNISIKGIIDHS